MKCILFTSILSGGGAERVLCQLANKLSEEHSVTLAAAYPSENEYAIASGVQKVYLDSSVENKKSWKQIVTLRNLIKTEKPDICISFLPQPNFKILMASFGLRNKVIVSVRNDPVREYGSMINRILAYVLYPRANGIVFQTRDAQDFFPRRIRKKSRVIMNQVCKVFFEKTVELGCYFVATGRLNEQKNYPMMIRAFAKFVEKYPDEELRIYGAGEKSEELKTLIKSLGAECNIRLMGQTNDIPTVLSQAKCFLLTSNFEGMPNGLLEAAAIGLPCVSTDCPCGGPREIIENDVNGILIPINDEDALYHSLCRVQEDICYRNKIAINARKGAMRYHPDVVFQLWMAYINAIVKGGKNE